MANHSAKTGEIGETMFEYFAKEHGLHLFRTQPATRVISQRGKPVIINCGTGGIADYTGYHLNGAGQALYCAVEVKTRSGDTMRASALSKDQRDWKRALPKGCAYTYVWWLDHCKGQLYAFKEKGSYKFNG